MEQMTIRIASESLEELETEASKRGVSKSEIAREWIERGSGYEELQSENERLHRRIEALIQQRDEHQELVEYVTDEKKRQRKREEKEDAPALKRAYWWWFGYERK